MYKKILCSFVLFLVSATFAFAQTSTITGVVTDGSTDEVVPQVNVFIVELERGDATDFDGEFEISNVEYGTYTIRASSIGFTTYEETITVDSGQTTVDITLQPDTQVLDDIVVTAFGLDREQRSLGYSIQEVSGEAVTRTDQTNVVGALAGKVAGVQVVGSSGANIGGSERIRIRGMNGLSQGQPLFVVDGTPVDNSSFALSQENEETTTTGRDLGNLASDLNLQSVESISVLKGAAAAALYGNRASNGVILVETKKGQMGEQPIQVNLSNSTYFENVYILPEYQNQYAGGYVQSFNKVMPDGTTLYEDNGSFYEDYDAESGTYSDPYNGEVHNALNYAADESWGPRIDGTEYRPWWSWFDHDFTGDGQSDLGRQVPLEAQPDNVRDYFETGVRVSNNLSISGGANNASYRVGLTNITQSGVLPNSTYDQNSVNFSGALSHSDKFTSRVSFNYVNTAAEGRPAQGYSAVQGNPFQAMNQWYQRQLNTEYLKEYRMDDGSLATWNIRSPRDPRPLYWDSPYFSTNENVQNDDRDRVYGNYSMNYSVLPTLELIGKLHLDTYSFTAEDRIATGGLEEDWYYVSQRSRREINYEAGARFSDDFQDFSVDGYLGGNIRTENYSALIQQTVGGLSTPNFFNIDASINRPSVSNFVEEKQVNSLFGTVTVGFQDLIYVDASLRNDWSSALPADDNSNLYYGLSGSLVFTEFDVFANQNILSFGKLRASIAQVGNDLNPYQVFQSYESGTPYGTRPAQEVPNTLNNPNLEPSVSSDYEFGVDLRFLDGRVRTDINYYNSVRENEILDLSVSGSSGYEFSVVNAGKFTTTGLEVALGATVVQSADFNVDLDINWSTSYSEVNELAEGITSRLLESASFGAALYANEGEEWGTIMATSGYGGYSIHEETGEKIVEDGSFVLEPNKEIGHILPDWNGGLNLGINYKNWSLGTFVEFQKGGLFYSANQMWGRATGLSKATVGNNALGNPVRNPVLDAGGNTPVDGDGDPVDFILAENASPESGGVLVEGVTEDGEPVAYMREAYPFHYEQYQNKEAGIEDASYVKLREVKLTYNLPSSMLSNLPLTRASIALDIQNALLLYASADGVDPSIIQNNGNGFGWWEGGGLPGTRSIGFNINVGF